MIKLKFQVMPFSLILILSVSYLILHSFYITPAFSDENIYINMARGVSDGLVPYRDFFFAHPPLQLFLFQPILFLFGPNFFFMKIFIAVLGIATITLTYLIAREFFGDFAAFIAVLSFLLFPGFLIFGNQGTGMFEALFFFLVGFYFLIKKRLMLSPIFFTFSIFTRYMPILLLPFVVYYLFQFDRKNLPKFLKFQIMAIFLASLIFALSFGESFLIDTLLYHTQANLSIDTTLAQWLDQYLTLGFFTFFLSITAIFFAIIRKDYKILIFAAYPLLYDALVLFSLKAVIYHYFVLGLPFLFISIGATFSKSEYFITRALIVTILAFSIMTNLANIGLYSDKVSNGVFPTIANYVESNLGEDDTIFGEPRTTNYVSFVTGAKIANNYFDSDSKFMNFAGRDKIFYEVNRTKPAVVIIDNNINYISKLEGNYSEIGRWEVSNYYTLSLYRAT